jgi:SAM-dependent methyltransferase
VTEKLVREYYSGQGLREWRRLARDSYHRLEFDTTMHFIRKHFSKKKGLILDAGGGPGRYTIELAKLGYDVILLDFTKEMLQIAERHIKKSGLQDRVKQIVHGSIDNFSMFDSETFDAVICLGGALSHVVDGARREKAIDELIRVAKRGSPIFVSVIGRLALLVSELINFPQEIELDIFKEMRDTGDYRGGYGFAPCHFYLPEELQASFEKRKVQVLEMTGLEGLASGHRKETNRLSRERPKAWKIWWNTHLKTCPHPTSVGISEHFMIICKKNEEGLNGR